MSNIQCNELLTYNTASLYTFYKLLLKQDVNDDQRDHDEDDSRIQVKSEDAWIVNLVSITYCGLKTRTTLSLILKSLA